MPHSATHSDADRFITIHGKRGNDAMDPAGGPVALTCGADGRLVYRRPRIAR